ncbi:Uncharacterised protein [Pandoraea pulmonicola]|uniref:DUF1059 domain-containing protein n=2 Tax=Pandoraea pulmonicola TaxID=93221 RepID=A0AAJ4ZBR6_PANPU|nr:Uncharacterised protein [Pandoraea pulmonicola]
MLTRPRGLHAVIHSRLFFSREENIMVRKYIDCREFPSEMNCSVALCADSESELLEAAVQHAISVHKHADSQELRSQLKTLFHDGTPPMEAPRRG